MPTYLEELAADRDRLRRALQGLVEEQAAVVRRVQQDLAAGQERLDRAVLKLLLFSQQFGRGSSEVATVQREAEEANTPVVELTKKLERQLAILELYRSKLAAVDAGGTISVGTESAAG